jgi:hypothetical protein
MAKLFNDLSIRNRQAEKDLLNVVFLTLDFLRCFFVRDFRFERSGTFIPAICNWGTIVPFLMIAKNLNAGL